MSKGASSVSPRVLSFEDARRVVEKHAAQVSPGRPESLDLLASSGRILAEEIRADRDFPPFDRATRDGYAVRAADVATPPARLEVVGEIKAGDLPESLTVGRGQAVSIMTGAALPAGADAVVMVEYTSAQEAGAREILDSEIGVSEKAQPSAPIVSHPNIAKGATLGWGTRVVEVRRGVSVGENFVPRGAEARAGQVLLGRGRRLDHAGIAIAASVGKDRVQVFRKPRVAVLSTGDEVVEIGATPGAAQIRNSNSYSLAAQIQNAGGEPVRLAIAPDERGPLRSLIEEGLQYDLLLLTGGVSMGKYDLVEQVLTELSAEFYFTGAEIQPGRPVVFGSCGAGMLASAGREHGADTGTGVSAPHKTYFFGLPGNPVSTMVTFELFARPMIEALAGMAPLPLIFLRARLKSEIKTKTGLKRFLPAVLSGEFENAEVELARWQGSGDIATLARANCYVVIPPDRERIESGEWVSLLMQ
jgi:molybdopterin molybdotransferase